MHGTSPLATTTHARLRAAQGDVATARRILKAVLAARPGDPEATALLATLDSTRGTLHEEPRDEPLAPPRPARGEDLSRRFKQELGGKPGETEGGFRERLEELLRRIHEAKRGSHAR